MNIQANQLEKIKDKYLDPKKPQMIKYEEVIKQLIPIIQQNKKVIWVLRDTLSMISNATQSQPEFRIKRRKLHSRNNSANFLANCLDSIKSIPSKTKLSNLLGKKSLSIVDDKTLQNIKLLSKIMKTSTSTPQIQLNRTSHESNNSFQDANIQYQSLQEKLMKKRQISALDSFVAKDLSCATSNSTIFDPQQKFIIQVMLKKEKIDIKHLMDLKQTFIQGDSLNLGIMKQEDFLKSLNEQGKRYNETFLRDFLKHIRMTSVPDDCEGEIFLSYAKLMSLIDIFLQYPARSLKESNNSNNVKHTLEFKTVLATTKQDKLNKLLRHIHLRIEEKFKSFRDAFRAIDQNFDGSLSFKEFIEGLENIGISFSLEDFRKVFEYLDNTNEGCIDFKKFCAINIGSVQRNNYIQSVHLSEETPDNIKFKRPPLPNNQSQHSFFNDKNKNAMFANGLPPKNKDLKLFANNIQDLTLSEAKIKMRKSSELPSQSDEHYVYGSRNMIEHNMDALISNSYKETIPEFRLSRSKKYKKTFISPMIETPKKITSHQNTATQILRQESIKKKYLSFIQKQITYKPLRNKVMEQQIKDRIIQLSEEQDKTSELQDIE